MPNKIKKIAIISDTHNLLSQSAFDTLCGNFEKDNVYQEVVFDGSTNKIDVSKILANKPDLIIHAGDVGNQAIIDQLESVAPLIAVNGNCDFCTFKTMSGETQDFKYFEYEGVKIAVSHRPQDLHTGIHGSLMRSSLMPEGISEPDVAIHGHTHFPEIITPNDSQSNGQYYEFCPGSATQGRYGSPNSIMFLYLHDCRPLVAQLVQV